MTFTEAPEPGTCDAVAAEFAYGPVRCHRLATFTTEEDGETFYVCDEHIATSREDAS